MNILEIIAPEGFQDYEYNIPKNIFQKAGHKVITASIKNPAKGALGSIQEVDLLLENVNVEDYDVIIFIGGPGATIYQKNKLAHTIIQQSISQNKILAAICIAPTILAYVGVLKNKKATVWNGNGQIAKILEENGAKFTDELVTMDENIITANGPSAAEEFANKILNQLI